MRRIEVETWLDKLGVKWEYAQRFVLSEIDRKASLDNQARLEPLDEDVVERYALDMKNGDEFPALLVWMRPRSAPMLLGGNHRYHAFEKAGMTQHDAYLVWCDKSMVPALMYGDNRFHGVPPSTEERCAQALHLFDTGQCTMEVAARTVGTTVSRIHIYRATLSADRRAHELKIERFGTVPRSIRARLDAIESDPVFTEAATLVVVASMNQEAAFSFVTRLNEEPDDRARFKLIDKERALWRGHNRSDSGTVKMPPTSRNRAMKAVNDLSRCRPVDVAASCVDREQAKLLGETLLSGRRHLQAMLDELRAKWS